MTDGFRDLVDFLRERRKLWMLPIVLVFLASGLLVALAEGGAAIPFLYALF